MATNSTASYSGEEPGQLPRGRGDPRLDRGPAAHARRRQVGTLHAARARLRHRGPMADQTVIFEIELLGVGEDGQAAESQTASNGKAQ